jgi:hypothetical protein
MPRLRQAGDVVDLDYPPFFPERSDTDRIVAEEARRLV